MTLSVWCVYLETPISSWFVPLMYMEIIRGGMVPGSSPNPVLPKTLVASRDLIAPSLSIGHRVWLFKGVPEDCIWGHRSFHWALSSMFLHYINTERLNSLILASTCLHGCSTGLPPAALLMLTVMTPQSLPTVQPRVLEILEWCSMHALWTGPHGPFSFMNVLLCSLPMPHAL